MNWYLLTKSAGYEYGYWMTPSGGTIQVPPGKSHNEILIEKVLDGDKDYEKFKAKVKEGWIRLVTGFNDFVIETEVKPTEGQVDALLRMIRLMGKDKVVIRNIWDSGKEYVETDMGRIRGVLLGSMS